MTLNGRPFDSFTGWWFGVLIKPMLGGEKALAREFARTGTAYFLPMEPGGPKSRRTLRPLFDGYVFVNGTDGDRADCKTTGRVASIIDTRGIVEQQQFREQLSYFYDKLASGYTFTPPPVSVGCRARILANTSPARGKRNPFFGYEGTIDSKIDGRLSYTVIIEFFGRKTPIEVAADDLERI